MFAENKITNISIKINLGTNLNEELSKTLLKIGNINSFIIYSTYDDDVLCGWLIKCNISQTHKFNTISTFDASAYIIDKIKSYDVNNRKQIVGYMQPNVELLLKLYKPLIVKLSKEIKQSWQYLEMEDLIQMCNLVICDLYYKGYYVHKSLIRRSFINYVLMHIRKDKGKPSMVSLEQEYSKTDDDDRVTIADMIPDMKQMNDTEDKYDDEVDAKVLKEVKDIVIDFIGQRQYDQLLREYGNKSTTNWSRRLMTKIKAHLFEMGINSKSFSKYYN